jgi:polyisoprenoid-binding protein YceI
MNMQRMLCAAAASLSLFVGNSVLAGDTYKLDPVHATAAFKIKHANVSQFYGRINGPEGTIVLDEADPTKTTFDITLKAANIDSGNPKRDDHLKSPDFFSAQEFPTITFKSTSVKKAGDNKLEVTGDMTMHGQTKPITVTLEQGGPTDVPRMGKRAGFSG